VFLFSREEKQGRINQGKRSQTWEQSNLRSSWQVSVSPVSWQVPVSHFPLARQGASRLPEAADKGKNMVQVAP